MCLQTPLSLLPAMKINGRYVLALMPYSHLQYISSILSVGVFPGSITRNLI